MAYLVVLHSFNWHPLTKRRDEGPLDPLAGWCLWCHCSAGPSIGCKPPGGQRYRNLQVGIKQNKTTVIAETTTNMIDMISNLEEKKSPTGQERTKFACYHLAKEKVPCLSLNCGNLRRGDESQPLAGFFWSGLPPFLLLPATRSLFKAHYLYIYIYNTTSLHVTFFHTCPCFATLRHSFLGNTPHPLANRLAPNPNGCCSPLSFESLVFSICLPLCS